jgi:hypothetical protein
MNLYLLTQDTNNGYDTYDSCIVAAESLEDAVMISPSSTSWEDAATSRWSTWARYPKEVAATEIGKANNDVERGVILSSFNAG